jgi:predicted phage terminase large subunit-like protein
MPRARARDIQRDARGYPVRWKGHDVAYAPWPGPQTQFLKQPCFEILYGGQAGGGKTACGAAGALQMVGKGYGPHYKAVLFRRDYRQVERTLLPETLKFFPALGGRYRQQKHYWHFPDGEQVWLVGVEHIDDIKNFLGVEVQYAYFDELTTFEESQYTFAISRLRSAHGVPVRIRAGTNPGSEGHDWVFKRWGPWLDPKWPLSAGPNEALYYVKDEAGLEYCVPRGTLDYEGNLALGRTFIPSTTADNPSLPKSYRRMLDELDVVTRRQLKFGDWLIKPAKGLYYKRAWLRILDATPAEATRVRYWDLAGTEDDGDWTVGVKLARAHAPEFKGLWFVEDVKRLRGTPLDVENLIMATAEEDGRAVTIGLPEDPGAAGKFTADYYVRELGKKGFAARARRETGDKITRQNPVSAQAERLNIKLRRGRWNDEYIAMLEAFPEAGKDDVDALSGGFAMLTRDVQDYTAPAAQPQASIANNLGGF